jgi:hypothetical protein
VGKGVWFSVYFVEWEVGCDGLLVVMAVVVEAVVVMVEDGLVDGRWWGERRRRANCRAAVAESNQMNRIGSYHLHPTRGIKNANTNTPSSPTKLPPLPTPSYTHTHSTSSLYSPYPNNPPLSQPHLSRKKERRKGGSINPRYPSLPQDSRHQS